MLHATSKQAETGVQTRDKGKPTEQVFVIFMSLMTHRPHAPQAVLVQNNDNAGTR